MRERELRTLRNALFETHDGKLFVYVVNGDDGQVLECPGLGSKSVVEGPCRQAGEVIAKALAGGMVRRGAEALLVGEQQGLLIPPEYLERARRVLDNPNRKNFELVMLQLGLGGCHIISLN